MTKEPSKALDDLVHIEKNKRAFGFDWPNEMRIIQQALEECQEIKDALQNNEGPDRIQEEIGDLIHSAVSLCLFAGFDVGETIKKSNLKFSKRMRAVEALTQETGLENLQGQPLDFMLTLWRKAKLSV